MKRTLRHYKVSGAQVHAEMLLHARARLYNRVGKLLQPWPESRYKVEIAINKVEVQYAEELLACKALEKPLPVVHDRPPMPAVAVDPRAEDQAACPSAG